MAVRSNKFHRWCIWEDWLKIIGNQGPKWDADQGEPGLFSRTWSKFGGLGIRRRIYKACVVSNSFYTPFQPSGQLIPTWIVLMLFISGVCAQSQIYPLLYLGAMQQGWARTNNEQVRIQLQESLLSDEIRLHQLITTFGVHFAYTHTTPCTHSVL